MKKILIYIMLIILTLGIIFTQGYVIRDLRRSVDNATNNYKAAMCQIDSLNNRFIEYRIDIANLTYYGDSISAKLKDAYRQIGIREKNIKRLEYIASKAKIKDSIFIKDTIFVKDVDIDTTITNRWYSIGVSLDYPNKIEVNPTVLSEKYIVSHSSKETIDKPKRFFLWRWFQRKHNIIRVEVVEENPYITNTQTKFIEIVK